MGAEPGEPPHELGRLAAPPATNLAWQHDEALGPAACSKG